ncbi:MAG: hypothetical protein KAR39_12860 [Thermoplasmata archaeon]|nr:hypothetical protein [Thermoplasmata archaeon]
MDKDDLNLLPTKVWTAPAFLFFAVVFAIILLKAPDLETWRLTISYGTLLGVVLGIDAWYSSYAKKKTRLDASGFYLGQLPQQIVAGVFVTLVILVVALLLLGQVQNFTWEGTSAEVWSIIFQVGVVAFVESIVFQFVLPSWTYGVVWSQILFGTLHWNFVLSSNPVDYFFPVFATSIGFLWLTMIWLRTLTDKPWSQWFGLGFVLGSHATFNVVMLLFKVQIFGVVITWLNILVPVAILFVVGLGIWAMIRKRSYRLSFPSSLDSAQ